MAWGIILGSAVEGYQKARRADDEHDQAAFEQDQRRRLQEAQKAIAERAKTRRPGDIVGAQGPATPLDEFVRAAGGTDQDLAAIAADPAAAAKWIAARQAAQVQAPAQPAAAALPVGGSTSDPVVAAPLPQAAPSRPNVTVNEAALPKGASRYVADIRARAANAGYPSNVTEAMVLQPMLESGYNPAAPNNGSSTGFIQQHPDTFRQYGGQHIQDPAQQIAVMGRIMAEGNEVLTKALGRPPTPQELSVYYQQGAGGGPALLTADPNAPAADVLGALDYYKQRPGQARQAIVKNMGDGAPANPTVQEFLGAYYNKASKYLSNGPDTAGGISSEAIPAGPTLPDQAPGAAAASSHHVFQGADGRLYVTEKPIRYTSDDADLDAANAYRAAGLVDRAAQLEAQVRARQAAMVQMDKANLELRRQEAWQMGATGLATGDPTTIAAALNKMVEPTGVHYQVARNDQTGMYAIRAYGADNKPLGPQTRPLTLDELKMAGTQMFATPEAGMDFYLKTQQLGLQGRQVAVAERKAATDDKLSDAQVKHYAAMDANLAADAARTRALLGSQQQIAEAQAQTEALKAKVTVDLNNALATGDPSKIAAAREHYNALNGVPAGNIVKQTQTGDWEETDPNTGLRWIVGSHGRMPLAVYTGPTGKDPDIMAQHVTADYVAGPDGKPAIQFRVPGVIDTKTGREAQAETLAEAKRIYEAHKKELKQQANKPAAGAIPNFTGG